MNKTFQQKSIIVSNALNMLFSYFFRICLFSRPCMILKNDKHRSNLSIVHKMNIIAGAQPKLIKGIK